jgi:hypothetical protein
MYLNTRRVRRPGTGERTLRIVLGCVCATCVINPWRVAR